MGGVKKLILDDDNKLIIEKALEYQTLEELWDTLDESLKLYKPKNETTKEYLYT